MTSGEVAGQSKQTIVRRRRSVASQPYRLVFRSVPRRPSSSNSANLLARTTILADASHHIHTPNLVIGAPEVRVARPSFGHPHGSASRRARPRGMLINRRKISWSMSVCYSEALYSAVVSRVDAPRSRIRGWHYGSAALIVEGADSARNLGRLRRALQERRPRDHRGSQLLAEVADEGAGRRANRALSFANQHRSAFRAGSSQ